MFFPSLWVWYICVWGCCTQECFGIIPVCVHTSLSWYDSEDHNGVPRIQRRSATCKISVLHVALSLQTLILMFYFIKRITHHLFPFSHCHEEIIQTQLYYINIIRTDNTSPCLCSYYVPTVPLYYWWVSDWWFLCSSMPSFFV